MKKIVVEKDLGEKETFDKWNGKFLDKTSYDTLVKVTDEDVGVMKPVNSLDGSDVPLAYVITNVYNDNDVIRNTLMSIEDVSVMRANCSGPILEEDMLKKGKVIIAKIALMKPHNQMQCIAICISEAIRNFILISFLIWVEFAL